jgi:hypothetical protein
MSTGVLVPQKPSWRLTSTEPREIVSKTEAGWQLAEKRQEWQARCEN